MLVIYHDITVTHEIPDLTYALLRDRSEDTKIATASFHVGDNGGVLRHTFIMFVDLKYKQANRDYTLSMFPSGSDNVSYVQLDCAIMLNFATRSIVKKK